MRTESVFIYTPPPCELQCASLGAIYAISVYTFIHMDPNDKKELTKEAARDSIIKIIAFVIAALIGLAALITALLYDWTNKEPGETRAIGSAQSGFFI